MKKVKLTQTLITTYPEMYFTEMMNSQPRHFRTNYQNNSFILTAQLFYFILFASAKMGMLYKFNHYKNEKKKKKVKSVRKGLLHHSWQDAIDSLWTKRRCSSTSCWGLFWTPCCDLKRIKNNNNGKMEKSVWS